MLCLHLSIWYWFSTLENFQLTWTCLDCTGNKQDLKTFWERKKLLIKIDFNHWSQLQIINNVLAQALWVSPWRQSRKFPLWGRSLQFNPILLMISQESGNIFKSPAGNALIKSKNQAIPATVFCASQITLNKSD